MPYKLGEYEQLAPAYRRQIAEIWRHRGRRLDADAAALRREGDSVEAQGVERAALDYRLAADEIDLAGESLKASHDR